MNPNAIAILNLGDRTLLSIGFPRNRIPFLFLDIVSPTETIIFIKDYLFDRVNE